MRAASFLALACALFALAACSTVDNAKNNSEEEPEEKAEVISEEKLEVTSEEKIEEKTAEKAVEKPEEGEDRAERQEPDHVSVDHILIGVKHERLLDVTRSPADAKTLAAQIVKKLEDGGDWNALKDQYSDDRSDGKAGGPYSMANTGVEADTSMQEYTRGKMVPGFGNVGFALEVGEIGVADHDPRASPFGYHIIKRIK